MFKKEYIAHRRKKDGDTQSPRAYSRLQVGQRAHRRKKDGDTQSLSQHLREVSKLAGEFTSKIGAKELGELMGLLHDIGKASEEFEQYIKSAVGLINPDEDDYVDAAGMKGKVDHSTAGAQLIYRNLAGKGSEALFVAQALSLCIASHHSGLIDCLLPDGKNNFQRRVGKAEKRSHVSEAWSNLEDAERARIERLFSKELSAQLFSKLRCLREENDSKESLMFKYGLLVRFLFSCLIDADRLSTADFEFPKNKKLRNRNKYLSWDTLIKRFNITKFECKNKKVANLRGSVSQLCFEFSGKPRGLYQLTVPTGGGKTFSSLRFALNHAKRNKMSRIIYVVPYTSIIDQNADKVRAVLEEKDTKGRYLGNVVLEHHSNLTPDKETQRQNLLAENWDAPIVFTTVVQFLEALFGAGTRSARRMHQLANAVIVFDEVQTVPIRCVHMFNVALRFLVKGCDSTVVLCTATQPLLDKIEKKGRALQISPDQLMIKDVKKIFKNLKRVKVHDCRRPGGWSEKEVVDLTRGELQESGSVLVVVNTKSSAKNLYTQFKGSYFKNVFHLSTNMCPAHRMGLLDKIIDLLDKKEPIICVSTQLIEAGVDIDFGTVIRCLAGLDSIAQAAGRCNRHGARPYGNVCIVNLKDENLDRLTEIKIGAQKAERILDEFKEAPNRFENNILSPSAMEQYYQYYFYDRRDIMNFPVTSESPIGRKDNLFDLLSTNPISDQEYKRIHQTPCTLSLRQSFQSAARTFRAIDSPTRGIVVQYGKEGKQIVSELCATREVEKQYKLLKKAQRYSVGVYENVFNDLEKRKIIHEVQKGMGVFYLDRQYYSNEFGLSKEIINEMQPLIQELIYGKQN